MKISDITNYLEQLAPRSSQEAYDNSGLLIGDKNAEIHAALICLDCTEEVVQEAIDKKCGLIIAHHPILFKGLKSLTGANYVERTLLMCIKNNIAIYAIHTNLDNYWRGVNYEIGQRIGVKNLRILAPKNNVLVKLAVFVPSDYLQQLNDAVFAAGAGSIGKYESCHFHTSGTGSFLPTEETNPFEGEKLKYNEVQEFKAEYLVSTHHLQAVLAAMYHAHPYEEVAHDIYPLLNNNQLEGSGMVGELDEEWDEETFLAHLKATFNCGVIRHTSLLNKKIKRVAFCGGSGSFLLPNAKAANADIYITADFKYHEFFDADKQLIIADIGHYESEQFTTNLIADSLNKKFATFAAHLTEINTNPIKYF